MKPAVGGTLGVLERQAGGFIFALEKPAFHRR